MLITRHNIDQLIDAGQIEVAMQSGKWWKIRRNGRTKRWVNDPVRIKIPFKMGMYAFGSITETDFKADGTLDPEMFRLKLTEEV